MTQISALPALQAEAYQPHSLHSPQQVWVEKNCYVDVWIELLHALRLEPAAAMGFTLGVDFEGDQWTFFKPPLTDLRTLYGIDVQELTVWRPLLEHARHYLAAGKLISTEADAFWLPDTAGTDYRRQHTKTTIILNAIDADNQRLGYFHNAGYFELTGEDFRSLFRLGAPLDPGFMPLYAELIRPERLVRLSADELCARATDLLRGHFAHRPSANPLLRFGAHVDAEFKQIQTQGLAHYHAWAFATIRQCGAAFDLAAAHLRWLAGLTDDRWLPAAESFEQISQGCKTLVLKAARAVNSGRALDAAPMISQMARSWDAGMSCVARVLAR